MNLEDSIRRDRVLILCRHWFASRRRRRWRNRTRAHGTTAAV